jgi:hypothetical protein
MADKLYISETPDEIKNAKVQHSSSSSVVAAASSCSSQVSTLIHIIIIIIITTISLLRRDYFCFPQSEYHHYIHL